MLKPDFPKKGMEKEKWKERKGRNGKKEKEKDENEEKNNKKRKEKEGFPVEDRKEVKMKKIGGKQSNSRSMKEREQEIFRPDELSAR